MCCPRIDVDGREDSADDATTPRADYVTRRYEMLRDADTRYQQALYSRKMILVLRRQYCAARAYARYYRAQAALRR